MTRFPGQGKTYLSADTVAEDDLQNAYATEFPLRNATTLNDTEGWSPCHSIEKFDRRSWRWIEERNSIDCAASW